MSLRPAESHERLRARRDRMLRAAEGRLGEASARAMRGFLARMTAETRPARLEALTAASPSRFERSVALFGIGQVQGWWQEQVDEHVAGEVRRVWRLGYFDTADGVLLFSSLQAAEDHLANVVDRLVYTAQPTVAEGAFEAARVALSEEMARGSSYDTMARRLAAEFSWDAEYGFWEGRLGEVNGRLDAVLDGYGPPGHPDREAARSGRVPDVQVDALQRLRAELVLRMDADRSVWQTRAVRIARTEATAAYNAGALEAMLQEGAGVKVWLATGDPRTRDAHLEAHGACVPVRDQFQVGGEKLLMPGDPSGSAGNVINCRCTMVAADDCRQARRLYGFADGRIEAERAKRLTASTEVFHDGPGLHSGTGSPQAVHGTGAGAVLSTSGGVSFRTDPDRNQMTRQMLDAEPWWMSRDELEGGVSGLRVDPDISKGLAGHRYDKDGTTVMSSQFLDDTPFERFTIVSHEAGHDVARSLLAENDAAKVLAEFHVEGWRFDNPWGASDKPQELLADAYSELLFRGLEDAEPGGRSHGLLSTVAEVADGLGLPSGRVPGRPRVSDTVEDRPSVAGSVETFHEGPGAHPGTGTPQQVHAGGGGAGVPYDGSWTDVQVAWRKMQRDGTAQQTKAKVNDGLVLGEHGVRGLLERMETDEEFREWVEERAGTEQGQAWARNDYRRITGTRADPEWSDEELYLRARAAVQVSHWASTSSDESSEAWALQWAAAERWGGAAALERMEMSEEVGRFIEEGRWALEKDGPWYHAFLDTMYQRTQADLQAKGITEVVVARGMKWGDDGFGSLSGAMEIPGWVDRLAPAGGESRTTTLGNMTSNPLSSWSMSKYTAQAFAEPDFDAVGVVSMVTVMKVPASRVLSSPFTGLGCLSELELVLVGGGIEDSAWARISTSMPEELEWGGDD